MRRTDDRDDRLVALITVPLRIGTGLAVVLVAIGLGMAWAGGGFAESRDHTPLIDQVAGGGAAAVASVGLLLLTLVPLGVAIGTLIGFWRAGERRYLIGSAVVSGLLVASLALSLLVLAPST